MENPLVVSHFTVEISGMVTGFFTEVSGLGSSHEVIDHKVTDTTANGLVQKIPGRLTWENITLKRGITSAMDFYNWRKTIEDGQVDKNRRNGSIFMFAQDKQAPVAQWDFINAWPVKVSGPVAKSDSNEIGIEEMVITHEKITRVK